VSTTIGVQTTAAALQPLPAATPWPNANARLLGLGAGLPVSSLDRLAQFSATEFERFTLEWATGYLAAQTAGVYEAQQRGGAGDKGRDIVVWLDPPNVVPRRWRLYQCKHYDSKLGFGKAAAEIGKVLHYTLIGDYTPPEDYWFVTHKGVTSPFQDLLDSPGKLRDSIIAHWSKHCANEIKTNASVDLTAELRAHINGFDFSIFRAKQPLEIIEEHSKTRFHLAVFGAPLINRPKPPNPPSAVAPAETKYVRQLYQVIGEQLGCKVTEVSDFSHEEVHRNLFERSRITFYCAEGLSAQFCIPLSQ